MNSSLSIRITVSGRLSQRLAGAFDGLTLAPRADATELTGEVVDQTQLYGLLTRIRDLGLELKSVRVVDVSARSPREVRSRPRCLGTKVLMRGTK